MKTFVVLLYIHKGNHLYNALQCLVVHKTVVSESIFNLYDKEVIIYFAIQKIYVFLQSQNKSICPDGGIGRRVGLKHQWINFFAGSIPALGTQKPLFID